MNKFALRWSFAVFHATVAAVILVESVRTLMAGLAEHPGGLHLGHLVVLGFIESVGAVLFLIPRTLAAGTWLLLLTLAVAIAVHGPWHELSLLVFATGVVFIRVHGSVFDRKLFVRA